MLLEAISPLRWVVCRLRPRGLLSSATIALVCAVACSSVHADQAYKPGQSFHDCPKVCPEVVVVPPGTYLMGSLPDDPHQALDGIEQPQHRVTLGRAFAVGKFQVTRDEFAPFAR